MKLGINGESLCVLTVFKVGKNSKAKSKKLATMLAEMCLPLVLGLERLNKLFTKWMGGNLRVTAHHQGILLTPNGTILYSTKALYFINTKWSTN